MKHRTVALRWHQELADVLEGQGIVALGIGPSREAVLLAVDPADQAVPFGRDAQPEGASLARSVAERPYSATAIRVNTTLISRVELPEVEAAFPYIQPFADDSTLIVSGRCQYRNGHPEHNAVSYDQQGQVRRRMVFGDGIQDVQVARDQRIWVSYFDEGVLGNNGWPHPPLGADGLLCFDADGQILWRFHAPGGFRSMTDCYALNVANDAVWACYYTEFPLVQVTAGGTVRGWENTFGGARALAIDRQRVLLWGGYGAEPARGIVQTIAGEKLVSPQRLHLCLPNGEPLKDARVIGRDSILHAFVGTTWYQFDLRELPMA